MIGDVAAFVKFGFSSWKLDGCGGEWNLVEFNTHMNSTGKAVMVENCHWGIIVRVGDSTRSFDYSKIRFDPIRLL